MEFNSVKRVISNTRPTISDSWDLHSFLTRQSGEEYPEIEDLFLPSQTWNFWHQRMGDPSQKTLTFKCDLNYSSLLVEVNARKSFITESKQGHQGFMEFEDHDTIVRNLRGTLYCTATNLLYTEKSIVKACVFLHSKAIIYSLWFTASLFNSSRQSLIS